LLSSIDVHQQRLGGIPHMVAADAGFYSRENEKVGAVDVGAQQENHKSRTETS
jgi:hypothetical protein